MIARVLRSKRRGQKNGVGGSDFLLLVLKMEKGGRKARSWQRQGNRVFPRAFQRDMMLLDREMSSQ